MIDRLDGMGNKELSYLVMIYGFGWGWKVVPKDNKYPEVKVIIPPKESLSETEWKWHILDRGLYDIDIEDERLEEIFVAKYYWDYMIKDFSRWSNAGKLLEKFEEMGIKIPSPINPRNIMISFIRHSIQERKN